MCRRRLSVRASSSLPAIAVGLAKGNFPRPCSHIHERCNTTGCIVRARGGATALRQDRQALVVLVADVVLLQESCPGPLSRPDGVPPRPVSHQIITSRRQRGAGCQRKHYRQWRYPQPGDVHRRHRGISKSTGFFRTNFAHELALSPRRTSQ